MEIRTLNKKRQVKIGVGFALGIFALIILLNSWTTIKPGERGFMYKPFSTESINVDKVYGQGTYFMLPWNKMFTYEVFRKSNEYEQKFLDRNGMDIDLSVSVNYNIIPDEVAKLHLDFREEYKKYVDEISRGAFKDIIGRYTYEEVFSTKREELEKEMEDKIRNNFEGNHLNLNYVKIIDVVLPEKIAIQIKEKETQKQRNLTAQQKALEEQYLADARIERARGDSAQVVSARFKAEAIRLEAKELTKSPLYIELKKWEKWDGEGSPYGEGNVFGGDVSILKQQK